MLADFQNGMSTSKAVRAAIAARPDLLAVIGDLDHRGPAVGRHGEYLPLQDAPKVLAYKGEKDMAKLALSKLAESG